MSSEEEFSSARSRWQRARDMSEAMQPIAQPINRWARGRVAEDLMGFWLLWHLEGGYEGVRRVGLSHGAIYRRISMFRRSFGSHPDNFEMPGVTLDVAAYLRGSGGSSNDESA